MLKKILTFFLTVFLIAPGDAQARDLIESHLTSLFRATEMQIKTVNGITIYYENESIDSQARLLVAERTIIKLMRYTAYDHLTLCQNLNVKMFLLDYNTINDRDVMHFLTWSDWGNINIWGAYDSFHDKNVGELYINTGVTETRFIKTVAHEFYHHIQDITCEEGEEQPAVRFADEFCDIFDEC